MTTEIRDFGDVSLVMIKPMEQCRYYPKCKVPLCPLDNQALETAIWYPDEPICRRKGLPDTRWLSIQRRIARKAVKRDLFFQISDLKKIKNVHKGIRGHNPDARYKFRLQIGSIKASGMGKNRSLSNSGNYKKRG